MGRQGRKTALQFCTANAFALSLQDTAESYAPHRRHIWQYASASIIFEKIEPEYGELYSFGKKVPPRHI